MPYFEVCLFFTLSRTLSFRLTMNVIILILYLILLVDVVKGSVDVIDSYDVTDLRKEFNKILGDALLNKTGLDIVKISRARISDMDGTSCTREVLNKLTDECDRISDQAKLRSSMAYLVCMTKKDGIELPSACTYDRSWLSRVWTGQATCLQALVKGSSLWTTFDGFRRDIDSVCFTHTFDRKLLKIETGTLDLIEAGHNLTTSITDVVSRVYEFEMRAMPYLQSIENGVHNTLNAILSLTTIVSKLYDLTERISDRVDVILISLNDVTDRVEGLSHDVLTMGSVIENSSVTIDKMSGKLDGFEGKFDSLFALLDMLRPLMIFVDDGVAILGKPSYFILFVSVSWIWWYRVRDPFVKLFSVLTLCMLRNISLDDFGRLPPYMIMVGCVILLSAFVVIYRLFIIIPALRRCKNGRKKLEQWCNELS
jgi:hypothetical protein